MNEQEVNIWEKMVKDLAKDGDIITQELTREQAHLWHMATGVAGEAGELLDAVKKHVIYQKPIDRLNVMEELGDLEFYMAGLRQGMDILRGEVLDMNYNKLHNLRYPNGYSDEAAQARADKNPDVEPQPSPFQET